VHFINKLLGNYILKIKQTNIVYIKIVRLIIIQLLDNLLQIISKQKTNKINFGISTLLISQTKFWLWMFFRNFF